MGLFCLVGAALAQGAPLRALAYLIWFHCYFRPMELIGLLASQVVPPVAGRTKWGFLLSPAEQQLGSKTGQLDESVLMDWDEVPGISRALRKRHRELKPIERFWPFTKEQITQSFKEDVDLSGVHLLAPHFYSFRHGGASDDFMTGRRRRDEIQHRGRWLSEVSVRRYGKAARTMKEAEKMPPAAHRYADLIWSKLSRLLDGSERAPMPLRN